MILGFLAKEILKIHYAKKRSFKNTFLCETIYFKNGINYIKFIFKYDLVCFKKGSRINKK